MTSDSVNLGSNPSPPATTKADVSGVSGKEIGPELPEGKERTAHKRRTDVGTGFVYFITDGDAIKIGWSGGGASLRLPDLQTGNPRKLKFLGCFPGAPKDERDLHRQFDDLKLTGEWFRKDPRLLDFIKSACAIEKKRATKVRAVQAKDRATREAFANRGGKHLKTQRHELRKYATRHPGDFAVRSVINILCNHLLLIERDPSAVDRLRPHTQQAMAHLAQLTRA